MGKSGGGTTTTSQNTSPWSGQQPYLTQQYSAAQNLYNNPSDYPQYYPSSEVAPLNSTETGAINQLGNLGANGSTALSSANNALTSYANGDMLSASNPYFQNMADTIKSTVQPQLEAGFNAGNSMNSPAAAFGVSQGLNNAIGNFAYQNYSDQSKNQLTAANEAAPNYYAQITGGQAGLQAGQTSQTQDQNVLNNQINAYNYNQTLPYQMLDQYITQTTGNPGSSTTSSQPYYNNNAQNAIGTALSAASLAAMLM